jgi:hypothetical protein
MVIAQRLPDGEDPGETIDQYYARLAGEGITRFRYLATTTGSYGQGEITVTLAAGAWNDTGENPGSAATYVFRIQGPTAIANPVAGSGIDGLPQQPERLTLVS